MGLKRKLKKNRCAIRLYGQKGRQTMTQNELKAVYTEELKKAWDTDEMVKHCSKSTAFVIEHDGALYGIEKPRIETSFCFGYGINGISDSEQEQEAEAMAETAQKSADYFINQNLKIIDEWIERLKEILEGMEENWDVWSYPRYMIATGEKYTGQQEDCKLRYYSIVDTFYGATQGKICNDTELIKKLLAGYEEVRADFIKRLNTYLKRYGLSKVKTWSYLRD